MNTPGGNAYEIDAGVVKMALTQGQFALMSVSDLPLVESRRWYAVKASSGLTWYAMTGKNGLPDGMSRLMHRHIAAVSPGECVDHVDGNGLNNLRENIRCATRSQNNQNSRRRRDSSSGYKGVYFHRASGKWMARVGINGKHRYLGLYDTALKAAVAYDACVVSNFGEFAKTNQSLGLRP